MPQTRVVFYRDDDGSVPALEWLASVPPKVLDKCRVRIERLRSLGHELRRPEADLLRDGIHELRIGFRGQNYRLLYFFHANIAAVLSHGLIKERAVPPREIDLAVNRRRKFQANPPRHTFEE